MKILDITFLKKEKKRTISSKYYNQYVDGHTHKKRWKAFLFWGFGVSLTLFVNCAALIEKKNVQMLIPAFTAVPQPVEVNDLDRPQN